MRECLVVALKKKGSALFRDSHRKRVGVQILLGTLPIQVLVRLALPNHFEPLNCPSLAFHHQVLLLGVDRL